MEKFTTFVRKHFIPIAFSVSTVFAIFTMSLDVRASCSTGTTLISGACYAAQNSDSGEGNWALLGEDSSVSPGGIGVQGTTNYGAGVVGSALYSGVGVQGGSMTGAAVAGLSGSSPPRVGSDGSSNMGVWGSSSGGDGGHFVSSVSGYSAVAGVSSGSANGVYGTSANTSTAAGILGKNTGTTGSSIGVWGTTASAGGFAVYGNGGSTGTGVFGDNRNESSGGNAGVNGQTKDPTGQGGYFSNQATTGNAYGVEGVSSASSGAGVYGYAPGAGYGVYGNSASGGIGVYAYGSGSAGTGLYAQNNTSGSIAAYIDGNMDVTGCIKIAGVTFGGTCSSDRRLKKNIEPVKSALERIVQLRGVTYEWINPAELGHAKETGTQMGFLAQEVESVFPKWVGEDADGHKTLTLPPIQLAALEVEAIRTLNDKNKDLESRNKDLENRVSNLENGSHPIAASFTAGLGISPGNLGLALLTMLGCFAVSRRKQDGTKQA